MRDASIRLLRKLAAGEVQRSRVESLARQNPLDCSWPSSLQMQDLTEFSDHLIMFTHLRSSCGQTLGLPGDRGLSDSFGWLCDCALRLACMESVVLGHMESRAVVHDGGNGSHIAGKPV